VQAISELGELSGEEKNAQTGSQERGRPHRGPLDKKNEGKKGAYAARADRQNQGSLGKNQGRMQEGRWLGEPL